MLFEVRNVTLICVDTPHTSEGVIPVSAVLFFPKEETIFQNCTQGTDCSAGLSCYRMIKQYTYATNITKTGEFAVHHPGRPHPDANGFRRLQQRLFETGRVTITAPVNAGHLSAVRTPGHEDAIIAAVAGVTWRSTSDITREF
jgi:hypothetical protein